jgi:hypothetical protein
MLLRHVVILSAALSFGCAGVSLAADNATGGMSKDEYKAEKDRIGKEAKAEKDKCKGMSGNAKDICNAEAKGHEKVAKAELEARYKDTPKAQAKVEEAKADAAYAVAKEKCDDKNGNDKKACMKDAKAAHKQAKADAKASMTTADARHDARQLKRDAAEERSESKPQK